MQNGLLEALNARSLLEQSEAVTTGTPRLFNLMAVLDPLLGGKSLAKVFVDQWATFNWDCLSYFSLVNGEERQEGPLPDCMVNVKQLLPIMKYSTSSMAANLFLRISLTVEQEISHLEAK